MSKIGGAMLRAFVYVALVSIALMAISGCSMLDPRTLRCGVDEDRSYVELINVTSDVTSQVREFADLCGFAYDPGEEDG